MRRTSPLVVCLLALCQPLHAQPGARGDGSLILVGGALSDASIYREIIRRAGGEGKARVGIIAEASRRYAEESARDAIGQFRRYGAARAVRIALDERTGKLRDPAQLDGISALFFTGGDQERLRSILRPYGEASPALRAIARARERGLVMVAGTSAGAAVQVGPYMVMGGESYEALGGRAEDKSDLLSFKGARRPGFGLFSFGAVDTHCSARGREGRMAALAAATRQPLAFGVDENTALIVERPGAHTVKMSVLGEHGVSIVDLSSAAARQDRTGDGPGRWTIHNLRLSYLTSGDGLALRKAPGDAGWAIGQFGIAPAKRPVKAVRTGRPPSNNDIFSSYRNQQRARREAGLKGRQRPRELVRLAGVLFGYRDGAVVANAFEDRGQRDRPVLEVGLRRDAQARAYGPIRRRSITNLRVDLSWKGARQRRGK